MQTLFRAETGLIRGGRTNLLRNLHSINTWRPAGNAYRSVRLQPDLLLSAGRAVDESRDGGAKMRFRCIPELGDEGMPFERLLHDPALNPFAPAVYQANFAESGRMRGVDVLLDDGRDRTRRERVEVEMIFDGDAVGHRTACFLVRVGDYVGGG